MAESKLPVGALALATTIQSLALPAVDVDAAVGGAASGDLGDARALGPCARASAKRASRGTPSAAPTRCGCALSMTTWPVRPSIDPQLVRALALLAPIARRKLSTVTSKCTNARLRPSACGISVALATTHSLVSGETYGPGLVDLPEVAARRSARRRPSAPPSVDRSAGLRDRRRAPRGRTPRRWRR